VGGKASSWLWVSVASRAVVAAAGGYGFWFNDGSQPTVSFSMPAAATTINFGQAVTVAWTTGLCHVVYGDDIERCRAAAFNGSEMLSGSQTVVPTAAGKLYLHAQLYRNRRHQVRIRERDRHGPTF